MNTSWKGPVSAWARLLNPFGGVYRFDVAPAAEHAHRLPFAGTATPSPEASEGLCPSRSTESKHAPDPLSPPRRETNPRENSGSTRRIPVPRLPGDSRYAPARYRHPWVLASDRRHACRSTDAEAQILLAGGFDSSR